MDTFTPVTLDPVVFRFRDALRAMYGDRIERIILFGSRARGDFHEESDYDVAVFLKTRPDWWEEQKRLADLRVQFLSDDVFFDAKAFPISEYVERTPLMHEIRLDGIEL